MDETTGPETGPETDADPRTADPAHDRVDDSDDDDPRLVAPDGATVDTPAPVPTAVRAPRPVAAQ